MLLEHSLRYVTRVHTKQRKYGSDYSDFEAFIEGEDNERVYDPISEIRPWRFEPPG